MNDYFKSKSSALDEILKYLDERSLEKLRPKKLEMEESELSEDEESPMGLKEMLAEKDPLNKEESLPHVGIEVRKKEIALSPDAEPKLMEMEEKEDEEEMSPEDMEVLKRLYSTLK